eukprot:TRINITY_DN50948_c0_g1_i1.p1 TRINITY_DN50948_c0_g1~~TRINITY_DN50948_c0_g1_i1.p1  ORF type:complete len:450 (-),score=97.87 TRINITY_DN50948_c0_g1_i1:37-1386(-)
MHPMELWRSMRESVGLRTVGVVKNAVLYGTRLAQWTGASKSPEEMIISFMEEFLAPAIGKKLQVENIYGGLKLEARDLILQDQINTHLLRLAGVAVELRGWAEILRDRIAALESACYLDAESDEEENPHESSMGRSTSDHMSRVTSMYTSAADVPTKEAFGFEFEPNPNGFEFDSNSTPREEPGSPTADFPAYTQSTDQPVGYAQMVADAAEIWDQYYVCFGKSDTCRVCATSHVQKQESCCGHRKKWRLYSTDPTLAPSTEDVHSAVYDLNSAVSALHRAASYCPKGHTRCLEEARAIADVVCKLERVREQRQHDAALTIREALQRVIPCGDNFVHIRHLKIEICMDLTRCSTITVEGVTVVLQSSPSEHPSEAAPAPPEQPTSPFADFSSLNLEEPPSGSGGWFGASVSNFISRVVSMLEVHINNVDLVLMGSELSLIHISEPTRPY